MDPFQSQHTGFIAIAHRAASVARMERSAMGEFRFPAASVQLAHG
jgi:hypothetical protein